MNFALCRPQPYIRTKETNIRIETDPNLALVNQTLIEVNGNEKTIPKPFDSLGA
jgi:hypothetical protein